MKNQVGPEGGADGSSGVAGLAVDPQLLSAVIETQNDIAAVELDPVVVMQIVVERSRKLTDADFAVIDMIEGDETVHRAATEAAADCIGLRLKIGSSLTGLAIRGQAILRCDDSETDPRVDREACRRKGVRAIVVVPLVRDGAVLGLLRVLSCRPRAFDERHVAVLQLMAGVVTAALRNASELEDKRRLLSQRDAALLAVRRSEQQFRLAFEHAPIGMALITPNGRWMQVNRALCAMLGYAESELLGTTLRALVQPGNAAPPDSAFAEPIPVAFLHKSGRPVWGLTGMSLVQNADGTPAHYIGQILDVTEQKRAAHWEEERGRLLEMVAQDRPPLEVLAHLAEHLHGQMPGVTCAVMFLQDGAIHQFAPSLPPDFAQATAARALGIAAELCAHEVGRELPLTVSSIASDAAWEAVRPVALRCGLKCCWATPVRSMEGTFAALLLCYLEEERAPSPDQRRILHAAGKLAALAVEHSQMTRQLAHLARHDVLTRLPNRTIRDDRLQQAITLAARNGHMVGLLALDLDHFKCVNDTYGHHAGDELLQQFAARIRGVLRESDTFARMGGDEFTIVLPELRAPGGAAVVAAKLMDIISAPYPLSTGSLRVTGSIGIAIYPRDAQDSLALQKAADEALYRAKKAGRNTFAGATPL